MLANANPYSGALPINPFAREIAAVCDKHAVPHGAPGKLDGFLRALHRNKHLAMDFWSLVVRISEEETSGSVDPDWLLAVIVEGVTGWNVAKLVASNTPDTPHLNELASMLAGEDLEELAPEPRAVAYPLRENDSLAEPVASLTPNQNQRLVLQPEPAIAANLVPNLLPLDDDQPSAFRLAGYAEAASGTTLPHAAILALLVIMLAAAGLLLFLHHDPSEWSRLRASVHTDLNAATFSHESRAAAAPTTPSPGSSTPNPFAISDPRIPVEDAAVAPPIPVAPAAPAQAPAQHMSLPATAAIAPQGTATKPDDTEALPTIPEQDMRSHLISSRVPIYPPTANPGPVIIKAIVTARGIVEPISVISGDPEFQRAALDSVATWQYRPWLVDGVPVDISTTITVDPPSDRP